MTRAPLIRAGLSSAAYIVTVAAKCNQKRLIGGVKRGSEPLAPSPRPITRRTASSACQECVKPEAIGVMIKTIAVMKISPRRPNQLLRGSDTECQLTFLHALLLGTLTPYAGKRSRDVGGRVDESDLPLISVTTWLTIRSGNPKFSGERQIY